MCQPHCWDIVNMSVCQSQDSVQSPNTPESRSSVANPLPSPVWVCFIRRPPWKGGGRWPPIGLSEKWASHSMLTIFQHGLEWRSPSITKSPASLWGLSHPTATMEWKLLIWLLEKPPDKTKARMSGVLKMGSWPGWWYPSMTYESEKLIFSWKHVCI